MKSEWTTVSYGERSVDMLTDIYLIPGSYGKPTKKNKCFLHSAHSGNNTLL